MLTIWEKPVLATVQDIVTQLRMEVKASGIDLLRDMKPTHRNIMVTCPFHKNGQEKKPSFGITTVDTKEGKRVYPAGTCHCFTCGFTSELPEFISQLFGHNDGGQFGYKWITSRYSSVTVDAREPLKLNMTRNKGNTSGDIDLDSIFVSEEELASYRFFHPYMYYRKLTDKVIDYFDIGYDQKTESLTFPVHDLKGIVRFIQRRSVGKKGFLNESVPWKGKTVYGLYHVYKNLSWAKEVIICESPIDALTCWTYRVPAVATMGALPTVDQLNLLIKLPIRKYIVGVDNPLIDSAGREGAIRLSKELGKHKVIQYLKFPDEVKDINAMSEEQFRNREVLNHRYF